MVVLLGGGSMVQEGTRLETRMETRAQNNHCGREQRSRERAKVRIGKREREKMEGELFGSM